MEAGRDPGRLIDRRQLYEVCETAVTRTGTSGMGGYSVGEVPVERAADGEFQAGVFWPAAAGSPCDGLVCSEAHPQSTQRKKTLAHRFAIVIITMAAPSRTANVWLTFAQSRFFQTDRSLQAVSS